MSDLPKQRYMACEAVDAMIFSGDTLYIDSERAELKAYLARWQRAVAEHEAAEPLAQSAAATETAPPLGASRMILASAVEDPHRLVTVRLQRHQRAYLVSKVFSAISNRAAADEARAGLGRAPQNGERIAALRELGLLLDGAV